MTKQKFKELWKYCNSFGSHNKRIAYNPIEKLADKFIEMGLKVYRKRGKGWTMTTEFIVFSSYLETVLTIRTNVQRIFIGDKYMK